MKVRVDVRSNAGTESGGVLGRAYRSSRKKTPYIFEILQIITFYFGFDDF
jgi:hypothetical protein